jgi:O-antigen/teichoic acid export membrane protein
MRTGAVIARAAERLGAAELLARLGPRSRYAAGALAGQIAYAAIAFVGAVLVARLLGPAGKGEYTAWTLATVVGTFALAASIPVGLGRSYLSGERAALLPAALRHAAILLPILAIAAIPPLLLGVDPVPLISCCVIAIPAATIVNDFLPVMQAAKRPWSFHGMRIASPAVFTLGMGGVAIAGADDPLNAAFVLAAAGSVASGVVAIAIARRRFGSRTAGSLRQFSGRGERSYLAGLIGWLLVRLDQYVLLAISGPFALGLYSVAVNWSEIGQYVGAASAQAVFEDAETLDQPAARRVLKRAGMVLAAALSLIVLTGFFLIGPVFGDQFADARWALLLLGPGIVAHGLAYSSEQMLFARGEGWRVSRIALVSLSFALVAWTCGALLFGIEGVAAGSSLAYLVQFLLARRALLGSAEE